jgi:hypothetical protein
MRREGLPLDTRVVEVDEVEDVADRGVVDSDVVVEAGVRVSSELGAASAPVVAAGRVVGVVPRAGRRDFLANSGISVGAAKKAESDVSVS